MLSTELGFFTTRELITELMGRKTFLGVVVHSCEDLKGEWVGEKVFQVHVNENLAIPQASRLLEVLAERMDEQEQSI